MTIPSAVLRVSWDVQLLSPGQKLHLFSLPVLSPRGAFMSALSHQPHMCFPQGSVLVLIMKLRDLLFSRVLSAPFSKCVVVVVVVVVVHFCSCFFGLVFVGFLVTDFVVRDIYLSFRVLHKSFKKLWQTQDYESCLTICM